MRMKITTSLRISIRTSSSIPKTTWTRSRFHTIATQRDVELKAEGDKLKAKDEALAANVEEFEKLIMLAK